MNTVNCCLMGLASRPQLPPLDVESVIIIITIIIIIIIIICCQLCVCNTRAM